MIAKKSNKKPSAKNESKRIAKAVNLVTKIRKRIEGAKHYIDDTPAYCDRCKIRVTQPHCYERNGKVIMHLCTFCNNVVKPKRRVTKIIYTPM